MSKIHRYIIVDNLFTRYTVIVSIDTKMTSVWCNECEEWVADWHGDQLSRHTADELLEKIVDTHDEQVRGVPVEIAADTENFL